jgi:hypothetical protein
MKIKSIGKNKTELHIGNKIIFISYETPVAACIDGKFFKTDKKWSTSTSKHINAWIDGKKAETKEQGFFDNLIK